LFLQVQVFIDVLIFLAEDRIPDLELVTGTFSRCKEK
jgi:hypothetical protein